jgi:chloramphenicol-sensitive protein RarD
MPLYFRAVAAVTPLELLAHRVVWSVAFLVLLLAVLRRWGALRRALAPGRTRWLLLGSTVLIAANWILFIYGVWSGRVLQNSLGYFINPLLSVVLGVAFFRERLRPAQWLGLSLATAGLVHLVVAAGEFPWVAVALACSFALYGLLRKLAPVDALVGLSVETLFLLPASAGFLLAWGAAGRSAFLSQGWRLDALLLLSGVITAVPLLCFGQAARRLRLSTLGFLQYLAPSLQFVQAVTLFGEPFEPAQQVCFAAIWSALALVSFDSLRA